MKVGCKGEKVERSKFKLGLYLTWLLNDDLTWREQGCRCVNGHNINLNSRWRIIEVFLKPQVIKRKIKHILTKQSVVELEPHSRGLAS